MILTFFTIIVFVAEIIIAVTVILNLWKFDKFLLNTNNLIKEAEPKIQTIVQLMRKISEQIAELAPMWVDSFNETKERFIIKQLQHLLIMLLFWRINIKLVNKFRKSKILKFAMKGFNLLQSMI